MEISKEILPFCYFIKGLWGLLQSQGKDINKRKKTAIILWAWRGNFEGFSD